MRPSKCLPCTNTGQRVPMEDYRTVIALLFQLKVNHHVVRTWYFPALLKIITMTYRKPFARLTETKLSRHNEIHRKSQVPADKEKQTMKRFREEDDPYRRFLITGDSPHQQRDKQETKEGKILKSLSDPVTYKCEQEQKDKA